MASERDGSVAVVGPKPLVSVITVCLNSERFIRTAIESVLGQTYAPIEYIVVDGVSRDGTLDIVRSYGNSIRWISERDNGLYDAMNKGIAQAKGSIIGIINSDDWYEPEAVEQAVQTMSADERIGLVHGRLRLWSRDTEFVASVGPDDGRLSTYVSLPILHPTVFVRKRVYDEHGGFRPQYRIAGDYELYLRFRRCGIPMRGLDSHLANMRLGGQSSSGAVFLSTLGESWRAKRINRYPFIPSALGVAVHASKFVAYRILRAVGAASVIGLYRRRVSRRHRQPREKRIHDHP